MSHCDVRVNLTDFHLKGHLSLVSDFCCSTWIHLVKLANLGIIKQLVFVPINFISISINFEDKGKHEPKSDSRNNIMENYV